MPKSTTAKATGKPAKPHPDFPLYPHNTGRWAKRVKGRLHYFGKTAGDEKGEAALDEWLRVKDDLLAGRKPRPKVDGVTVLDLANAFLDFKQARINTGEISPRMYEQYQDACKRLVQAFGPSRVVLDLRPADFEQLRNAIGKTLGLVCIHNTVTRIRSVFKFGVDQGLLPRLPTFGQSFRKPSQKALRVQRAKKGPQMFTAEQLRKILDVATPNMKGMVLLGINAALGNTDVAELPEELIDFASGWLSYPRGKTGIDRRVPLWPETLAALREVIARRGAPKDPQDAKLLFIGKRGESYLGDRRGYRVHQEFIRVLKLAGIEGRSFYDLRRTFETIAEGSRDLSAVQRIMGHSPPETDMSARYRQMVGDDRLQDVANHVRAWLFGEPKQATGNDAEGKAGDAQAAARRTALQAAIERARQGIDSADGPTRRTLESVWLPDIRLAEEGDAAAVRRLLDVWAADDRHQDEDKEPGDDQDARRFRVVG